MNPSKWLLVACAGIAFMAISDCVGATTEIAITIDDLPGHVLFDNRDRIKPAEVMLAALRKHHLTGVYGMLNGRIVEEDPSSRRVLEQWVAQGQLLGNHTYSHVDLAKTALPDYLADIARNEPLLREMMGAKNFRYFRFPYLAEGETAQKREGVRQYLTGHGYKNAPVTMDFFDYEWDEPYQRCVARHDDAALEWLRTSFLDNARAAIDIAEGLASVDFGRPIKHVLLLHLTRINAEMMDSLLSAYEARGVKFIPLAEALEDPAYQFNPNIAKPRAYTFLNQVRLARHLDNPPQVTASYNRLPEDRLAQICK